MDLKDRASVITDSAKHRLAERHTDHLERENDRLKVENATLRTQTDREDEKIEKILDSLQSTTAGPKRHRIRRLMTLTVAAGGAYVIGAKAGRERYEQIKAGAGRIAQNPTVRATAGKAQEAAGQQAAAVAATAKDKVTDVASTAADKVRRDTSIQAAP